MLRKTIGLGAAVASLALVAPAGAAQGDAGLRKSELRGVPSRVATKLKSVERSLDRAQGYIDDGESAKAVTALASTNRNLRSALKAVKRRVVAGNDTGAASAYAFAAVADDVVNTSVNGFDGQDGDVVTALASSLDVALDSRDEVVAAIDALSDSDTAGYSRGAVADRLRREERGGRHRGGAVRRHADRCGQDRAERGRHAGYGDRFGGERARARRILRRLGLELVRRFRGRYVARRLPRSR